MHRSVMQWVDDVINQHDIDRGGHVLEVGSRNENGSVRSLFADTTKYIGVDMRDGPGVDLVAHAHNLPFPDQHFDTVISTEMLEHDAQFWLSLPEMGRVLREDGLMILTARGNGFPPHAFPNDYWRFMPGAGPLLLRLAKCTTIVHLEDPSPIDAGIFALGRKNPTIDVRITIDRELMTFITDDMRNLANQTIEQSKRPDGPNKVNLETCAMTGLDLAHLVLGDER